jgi:hypothetical protein
MLRMTMAVKLIVGGSKLRGPDLLMALLLLAVAALGLRGRQQLDVYGDGLEYIVQTQAIALDGRLSIDPARRADYWNRTNPFRHQLTDVGAGNSAELRPSGGGFGGLYPDRFGAWRYYHFWGYSAAVAPLYRLLHELSPDGSLEYHAFWAANLAFLLLPFLVSWRKGAGWETAAVWALIMFSPLIPYLDWQHPELFLSCLTLLSFQLADHPRWRFWSPLMLGAAASQNPPLALLFPLHLLYTGMNYGERRGIFVRRCWAAYALGAAAATVPALYFRHYFGAFNLIEAVGLARLDFAVQGRASSLLFSPMVGAVWSFPTLFAFLPLCVRRASAAFVLAALLSVAAMTWLSASTANLLSAQLGAARYMVWILAPLQFAVLKPEWIAVSSKPVRAAAFMAAAVLNLFIIRHFALYELPLKHVARFVTGGRAQPETAALYKYSRFHDDVEVLVENIRRSELPEPKAFNGIYIWNIGDNLSLWVISRQALSHLKHFAWPTPSIPPFRADPVNNLFRLRDGIVELNQNEISAFHVHPVLGKYVLAWVGRKVDRVSTSGAIYVRDSTAPAKRTK